MATDQSSDDVQTPTASAAEVFLVFLKLGLTSFGGPVAHLGYFNDEFVARRKWLTAAAYAEIVALSQFLPGPASSQAGMMIGLTRARLPGMLAAWLGFTLPSALLMIAFAYGASQWGDLSHAPWLHGLKIAAVAVVAHAVVSMARTLSPDITRAAFVVAAGVIAVLVPTVLGQIGALLLGGILGCLILKPGPDAAREQLPIMFSKTAASFVLAAFFLLLVGLPFFADDLLVRLFDSFYRAGALVFGGGHVVLPLLQRELTPTGLVDPEMFLAGYGAAQAVPGPLFTFAAFLGADIAGGWGALICIVAIFLPSFLLIVGVLPFWNAVRRHNAARSVLKGINAAVVGLLAAAFATVIVPTAIASVIDIAIAAALFVLLTFVRWPSWLVVLLGAAASAAAAALI